MKESTKIIILTFVITLGVFTLIVKLFPYESQTKKLQWEVEYLDRELSHCESQLMINYDETLDILKLPNEQ